MSIPSQNVNAWVIIGEDEPSGSSYKTPGSSYQTLIDYTVYQSTDQVNMGFFITLPTSSTTVPTGDGSQYTLQLGGASSVHKDGSTTQDYMNWMIQDSRTNNPNIKLLAMLAYDKPYIANVLNPNATPAQQQQNATNFANNLVTYLVNYGLDGFDVDWESPLDYETPTADFIMFFTSIRTAFDTYNSSGTGSQLYLTLSPADTTNMDGPTVNNNIDWLNLQLYSGFTSPSDFTGIGIQQDLLQYGCKFESIGNGDPQPDQTALEAYQGYTSGNYEIAINWRINSDDFNYEQASQIILYQMINNNSMLFDDSQTMALAGNPPITGLMIRHGEVLDAIQPTNTGSFQSTPAVYTLPQHGGNGGSVSNVQLNTGEFITEISGYTGTWFGWQCVLQISFITSSGRTLGPYGTMTNATTKDPFSLTAPVGQSYIAFSGTLINVPLASGNYTNIIASINATAAVPNGNFS